MMQVVLSAVAVLLSLAVIGVTIRRQGLTLSACATVAALTVASVLEVLDLVVVLDPDRLFEWKRWVLGVESLLPAAWLSYSLTHSRRTATSAVPRLQRFCLAATAVFPLAALLPPEVFFYSPDFATERVLFLTVHGYYFYLGLLLFAVISLINLEGTYSHASLLERWRIKFDFIGATSYLALLVLYYSQGLLHRSLNMGLLPVRSLILALAAAMMLYSLLARGSGVRIAVSRNMAYKSVVLVAVGLYLVAVGLMGEGLRYFGEGFPKAMAIAALFCMGIALVVILLSETLRRRVRVFIHKNFYRSKYDYQTQWLHFTDLLASARSSDGLMEAILAGYSGVFGMNSGVLFLKSGDDDSFRWAVAREQAPASAFFSSNDPPVRRMAEEGWIVNLREANPAEFSGAGEFVRKNNVIFLIPLSSGEGLEGIIALGRPVHEGEFYHYEDYDLMKTMARQAASALMNLRLSEELASARELEVMGRVSTFILHDLKNLVYTLSLTVDNARDHIADAEFQEDMLGTLGNTVNRMKLLIARLRGLPEKQSLCFEEVDLLRLAEESASLAGGRGSISVGGSPVSARVDREEIQKVVVNLVVNALEATEGKGPVAVEVGCGNAPYIRVNDAGCGIPDAFRAHLFSPFRTTKKKGLGIGLYQCRRIVEAHGGRIDVESTPGQGATFTVWL
ncbi:PEP-CTERM system histidine kinase PrsK [Geobacter sulfurreducens subsp. ethanolicus]|uniref:XrtA/PEP-CTERM system histidine kinase PrsK n=1 Tax=Geobacter sulfurreducens TaxID=35554 RepID=UPI00257440A6|nr:XrtA/PEP-CTERM system histidine kinase PrsK [Geobacter sulfurreducens]BEH10059.1 PEP-CTERM system histidine kinase PrsK [Geobacter sulfurreducens subsp. ethanolicus]